MSGILDHIRTLVAADKFKITAHAFIELHKDGLTAGEIAAGIADAVVVEDYPAYHAGPSILVLQRDGDGQPVHALWGIPKGASEPAFLVTAYRPDPDRWMQDFVTRRNK